VSPRLASNSQSSCLRLWSAGITDVMFGFCVSFFVGGVELELRASHL
jgi:hypothetical protein